MRLVLQRQLSINLSPSLLSARIKSVCKNSKKNLEGPVALKFNRIKDKIEGRDWILKVAGSENLVTLEKLLGNTHAKIRLKGKKMKINENRIDRRLDPLDPMFLNYDDEIEKSAMQAREMRSSTNHVKRAIFDVRIFGPRGTLLLECQSLYSNIQILNISPLRSHHQDSGSASQLRFYGEYLKEMNQLLNVPFYEYMAIFGIDSDLAECLEYLSDYTFVLKVNCFLDNLTKLFDRK